MPTTLLDVVCPEGAGEGQLVTVAHGGQSFDVTVPPGLSSGDAFKVEVEAEPEADAEPSMSDFDELANANDIISLSDDDDDGAWYYGGGDPSAGSAAREVVSAAVQASRLKPHEAASLRRIMKAVNTFTALDDIVREHAPAYFEYSPDGEQRLEWTSIHRQFVELVEARVSFELDQLNADNVRGLARPVRAGGGHASRAGLAPSAAHVCGARAWQGDLVALLASVSGQDAHADAFLSRLLSLSDYSHFCEQMRAGGGALRGGSAEDYEL